MDASDLNGGKADITREGFNLERMFTPEIPAKSSADEDRLEDENLNGDFKSSLRNKNLSPTVKRKLRKLKVNLNNSDDAHKLSPTAMKMNKRKASENVDLYSSESEDFNGFEIGEVENIELRCTVLQKLIAEVETGNLLSPKRRKVVLSKTNKHFASDIGDNESLTESDDEKVIDDLGSNNNCPDESELKFDKSTNNSAAHSGKLRKTRFSRGASPSSAVRQKVTVDVRNPAYRIPFEYGWKRELVYRASSSENQTRRMADIYYYTPEGKKVRSYREVIEFLTTSELTIDNFTFFKEPLGVDDPGKEIIRDAKKPKDSLSNKILTKIPKKGNEIASVKKNTPKKVDSLLPTKTLSKAVKATSTLKIKLPAKKGSLIKESKSPPLSLSDNEILTVPEWTPPTKNIFQERSPSTKSKKVGKIKVQEPCSIMCSASMGLIPTLHCCICLCLYHPECARNNQVTGSYGFICQNCKKESPVSLQNQKNQIFSPPPLIPISILNASTCNSKHQSVLLPTLQPIPKTESMIAQKLNKKTLKSRIRLKSKINKTVRYGNLHNFEELQSNVSLSQSINEFLQKDDKFFAQNVATIGEQRFIVVPKNNSAVLRSYANVATGKIGSKPPVIEASDNVRNIGSLTTAVTCTNMTSDSNISHKNKEAEIKVTGTKIANTISKNVHLQSHKLFQYRKILPLSFESNNMSPGIDKTLRHDSEETLENIFTNQDLTVNFEHATRKIRKKQTLAETDHRQYFMVSICAGYHALSRIFQYLKVQELLRAARVCRMWRDIAAHPSLWKTVRMKNSQVTDWDGLADTLKYRGTQHLDLRKMLIAGEADNVWKKFVTIIPKVTSLIKLELCRCPAMVVEEVMKHCPQLEVLSAMSIKCDSFNLEFVSNLQECKELRLKAVSGMSIQGDLISLSKLTNITHLSLTSVKDLGRKKVDVLHTLYDLQTLELGECSDFPEKFGTTVLVKLKNLERLRLEKGQGSCCTFDILDGISQLDNLSQLELVNFDVKSGFDKYLAACKNIKRLLIIPTYVSQSATSNNMILAGVTELSHNLTHFVWGVTQELLRVTELFVDQCNQMSKQITGDSIPVLKPVPCLKLIEDILGDKMGHKDTKQQTNLNNPQVEILPLPHLQKLLLTALPKTRVKILKIPFHATWRQSISDSTSQ